MAINPDVLKELSTLAQRSRVFLSMPWVPGLTPAILNQPGRYQSFQTDEGLERRHGIFRVDEASLSTLDHGGLYGDAVFEGILLQHGRLFVFKEHLKRWWTSAEKMGIRFPYAMPDLAEWIVRAVQEAGFSDDERGYLRPVLTRGFGNLGINPAKCIAPTVYVICSTIQLYPPRTYETGIELSISRSYHYAFTAGLTIVGPQADFPIVVGCSLRRPDGLIIEHPARILLSPGKALIGVSVMDHQAAAWDEVFPPTRGGSGPEVHGDVMFACYRDGTFAERLCDTGWQPFSVRWILGCSLTSLKYQDSDLADWIGTERLQVDMWQSLDGTPIQINGQPLTWLPRGGAKS